MLEPLGCRVRSASPCAVGRVAAALAFVLLAVSACSSSDAAPAAEAEAASSPTEVDRDAKQNPGQLGSGASSGPASTPVSCGGGLNQTGCACEPASPPVDCYLGPAAQAGVGACTLGKQTCNGTGEFAGKYGECTGAGAPKSCTSAGAACGTISDGCGGTLDCGGCADGKLCGGGGVPNQCGSKPCAPAVVAFDWGSTGAGPCSATVAAPGWVYTTTTDAYVGGFHAICTDGTWVVSGAKCVARGPSSTCHSTGTRCDGAGPATFPFPHCWTCCNTTDINGPACL